MRIEYLADHLGHVPELARLLFAEWRDGRSGETLAERTARLRGCRNRGAMPRKQEGYSDYVAASMTRAKPGYAIRDSVARILREDLSWLKDDRGNFTQLRYGCAGHASGTARGLT